MLRFTGLMKVKSLNMTNYSRALSGTDEQLLTNMGRRLAEHRLRLGLTQAQLAEQAGVGKRTVERVEAGHSAQLLSLIRLLRVLELLDGLEVLVPEPAMSPMQIMEQQRGEQKAQRKRASGSRKKPSAASDKPWSWGDDT